MHLKNDRALDVDREKLEKGAVGMGSRFQNVKTSVKLVLWCMPVILGLARWRTDY